MITLARWKTISARDQIGHIAAEVARARAARDKKERQTMLERALALVDLSLQDEKLRGRRLMFLTLRDEIAKAYIGARDVEKVYAVL